VTFFTVTDNRKWSADLNVWWLSCMGEWKVIPNANHGFSDSLSDFGRHLTLQCDPKTGSRYNCFVALHIPCYSRLLLWDKMQSFLGLSQHTFVYKVDNVESAESQWRKSMNINLLPDLVIHVRLIIVFHRIKLFSFHSYISAVRDKPVKMNCKCVLVASS
jgi:hypothetical protein